MKNIRLITFLILLLNLNGQYYTYGQRDVKRRVKELDSLDILINKLIDNNTPLESYDVSFPSKYKWRKGCIYKHSGDTVFGEIKNSKHQGGQTSIMLYYREDLDSKKQRYRADKLIGFNVENKEYLTKKFSDLPPSYIQVLEKGKLNLYFTKFRQVSGYTDYARQTDYITTDIVYELYIESQNNVDEELTGPIPWINETFSEFIIKYIEDYPELVYKIKIKKYDYSHLREIIHIYNTH